jgi:hypothetical protein
MTRQPRRSAAPRAGSEPDPVPSTPGGVSAIVILGAMLTAAGGIIAEVRPTLLLSAGERMNAAAGVYAGYLVSRNLALAVMLVATLVLRARRELTGLMVLTALIQVVDAIVDGAGGRWTLVPGVLALGVAFLVGAARLSPRPLWPPGTWRDTAIRESPPHPPASLDGGLGDRPSG